MALIAFTFGNAGAVSAKEGWYAGFGVGSNKIDLDTPNLDSIAGGATNVDFNGFDDNRGGYVLNGGYRLNANVALNFDFTSMLADLRVGYFDGTTDYFNTLDINSYLLTPGVNLIYPINDKFDVYAKLGVSFILTDIDHSEKQTLAIPPNTVTVYSETIKDWDIAPTLGFGAQWNFGKNWAATFEYTITQFEINPVTSSDVDFNGTDYETQNILVGLRYNFD